MPPGMHLEETMAEAAGAQITFTTDLFFKCTWQLTLVQPVYFSTVSGLEDILGL